MSELVSIVTPMFNAEAVIEQTLRSVQAQTHVDWEMLIIDDCSRDRSVAVVERAAAHDARIRLLLSKENLGPAQARNIGIEAARGRYLAFLDSDDLWHPQKLERQLGFMRDEVVLSCTAYQKISEDGEPLGRPIPVRKRVNYRQMLNSNTIPCLTAMYDVKQLGKHSMPRIGHEDYAYWLKLLKQGIEAHGLNEVLAYYRVRTGSVSNDKLKAAGYQWHIYRQVEQLSLPRSLYHFARYSCSGLKKQRVFKGAQPCTGK